MSNLARKVRVGSSTVKFWPKLSVVMGGKQVDLRNVSSEQRASGIAAAIAGGEAPEEIAAPSYREGAAMFWERQAQQLRSGEIQSGRAQWRAGTNFIEVVEARYPDPVTKLGGYARYYIVMIKVPEGAEG